MARPLRVATRGSTLARTQTAWVIERLGVDAEPLVVETAGDRNPDADLWQIGGQGVFVAEVEAAVQDGRADFAVHSAKDLPSRLAAGLAIAAVPERADPRDALVGATLDGLPTGGRVATGSARRRAQLAWLRPDLTFEGLRGNIETRLARRSRAAAVVVAAAALERLGRAGEAAEMLDPGDVIPQVGQGALALQCRAGDGGMESLLGGIDHGPSRRAVTAERAFLAEIGGGCELPVGAYATVGEGDRVRLTGLLASLDGRIQLRHTATGDDPAATGRAVARHLLDEGGGTDLLADLGREPGGR